MRAVIQRVSEASVDVVENGAARRTGSIGAGLVVLLAVENGDSAADAQWLVQKIVSMRIFEDENGKMNLPLDLKSGGILLVSQFTLFGNMKKGNRPSFNRSAPPEVSIPLYEEFSILLEQSTGKFPQRGEFGAMMNLHLVNDGPVTIILDSKNREL